MSNINQLSQLWTKNKQSCDCVCQNTFCIPETLCSSEPCFHGGHCFITDKGFNCRCQEGYSGKLCEGNLLCIKVKKIFFLWLELLEKVRVNDKY